MANKRIKKKQTKASILQQQYAKEYNKYLARVRNQQKQGVQIQRIKRVKNPLKYLLKDYKNRQLKRYVKKRLL